MSADLRVSEELLDSIGAERFEAYLKLFDATVVERMPPDRYGRDPFTVTYRLDVAGAPADAVMIVPTFQRVGEGNASQVRLQSIDWFGADGRLIAQREASDA